MKTVLKFVISLVVALTLLPSISFAQIDFNSEKYAKYGDDVAAREANFKNYSFFLEAFKMKSYDDAARRLNQLIEACPEANENFYLYGIRMYRNLFEDAIENEKTTEEEKDRLIGEILRMIELRAKYFPMKDGKIVKYIILTERVKEMARHDHKWEKYQENIIKESNAILCEAKEHIDPTFIALYFGTIVNKFLNDQISAELVLSQYDVVCDATSHLDEDCKAQIQKTIDGLLINSGAATCDNLITLFKPQYEKDPNNLDLIKKIMRYLNNANCDDPFKTTLAEKYYKLEPSADAAYSLARSFASEKNAEKAVTYFREAISRETSRSSISRYETELAMLYLAMVKNNELAARHAKRAIANNPRNGYAQYLLAQAYTFGSNQVSCDDFDKKAITWLIATTLEKARSLTASSAPEMKDIVKQISVIKAYFPTMEDIFFKENMKEGDTYTVNCQWIKGETKVQPRK